MYSEGMTGGCRVGKNGYICKLKIRYMRNVQTVGMQSPERRTLYVTDLDGTLLNGESRVSERSASILNRLIDRGVMFTPATARTPATVQPLLRAVRQPVYKAPDGQVRPLPSIVMTGAGLWNRAAVSFVSCRTIPEEDAVKIHGIFARHGLHPFVYCLSGNSFLNVYHPSAMSSRENAFYQDRRHLELKRFHLDQEPVQWDRVALFFGIGKVDMVERLVDELNGATSCAAAWYPDVFLPDTGLIDIYAPGVSKASAVKALAAEVCADETVVFGDNLNDLPMMAVADVAVATENALPEVKAKADIVIGRNTEDAVARWIEAREAARGLSLI